MAEKLSITIALEGGKAIEQQLEGIGTAGKKAFDDISQAAQQAGGFKNLKPEEVTTRLKDMGVVGQDAFNKITEAVKGATRLEQVVGIVQGLEAGFSGLATAALGFARALGPIAVAAGALGTLLVNNMVSAAEAINKADAAAIKLGLSIEKFDQLRLGLEKMGLSAKAIGSGIESLQKNLETLDVQRVAKAMEAVAAGAGLGSGAMKVLQDAMEGTGKAADDARIGLAKLVGEQSLKSLRDEMERTEKAAQAASTALTEALTKPKAALPDDRGILPAQKPQPGELERLRNLQQLEQSADLAAQAARRAKAAFTDFVPPATPLTGAAAALEKLGIAAGDVSQRLPEVVAALGKMPDSAQRSATAIQLFGTAAGTELVQALRTGGVAIDQFLDKQRTLTQDQANAANTWEQNSNKMSAAWQRFQTAVGGELLVTNSMRELTNLLNGITTLLNASGQQWADAFARLGEQVLGVFIKLGELETRLGGAIWDTFANAGTAAIEAITSAFDALMEKLASIGRAISGIFGGGGGGPDAGAIPGNARGGLLGGRGSGTSDSNLAWVSRGEHIMPARAVAQPGVLALLEALRRSGGNLRGVLDGMGRFAAGGVVPRFAEGGLAGGIGHLGTVDLRTDQGSVRLMAGASAVDQLSRLAVTKRMTSTGKKPGFIG